MPRHRPWKRLVIEPLCILGCCMQGLPAQAAAVGEPHAPHSIVAQSTRATAGTGRRPIGERIRASHLPVKFPPPADCAGDHESTVREAATADEDSAHEAGLCRIALAPPPVGGAEEPEAAPPSPPAPARFRPDEALVVVADIAAHEEPEPSPATPPSPEQVETGRATVNAAPAAPERDAAPRAVQHPQLAESLRDLLRRKIRTALIKQPAPAHHRASATPREPAPAAAPPPAADQPAGTVHAAAPVVAAAAVAPARLEFDIRESRPLVGEGEQILVQIAVRNVGDEPAERVTATLFFGEGMEPIEAIGHAAEVCPGEVRFATIPALAPGTTVDLLVTAVGTRPGSVAFRGELECTQLAGRLAREGAVTVHTRETAAP
ncbi:MAG: hypothetical protein EBZ74_01405 [Planctomycetia bacterium]|nr:hypothetical protein [Planctomycetia bacterium]